MVYKYLGWGITNENGVAKLDHDAQGQEIEHSYTGTGAGEIDVLASLDNPVVEGSIVSETLPVYDAWMRDGGVTGDVNNNDWLVQTGGSRTVGSDGTVFSGDTGSLFAWINKHGTTHSGLADIAEYSGDYGIELTVVEVNGSARCSIYEAYPSPKRVDIPLSVGKWLIKRINNVVTAFKDGVAYPITSLSLTAPQRIGIIASQGDSVKLRDIAVYGLGGTELGLTASKQVIESGETTTLSAYLSEGSGNTVQLYNADTDTLIGTMTDAGNGQYTYTVTGTGSGQKRYYAKYGSLLSEPYILYDCTFYDEGINVEGHYNTQWVNVNMQVSRNDTYTKLTSTVSGSSNQYGVPSAKIPSDNFVIEYTKTASTSNDFFIIKDFAWDLYAFGNGSLRGAGTVKWVVDTTNKTMTPYFDGVAVPNGARSYSNDSGAVRFQINGTDNDIEYNNFKIYPI